MLHAFFSQKAVDAGASVFAYENEKEEEVICTLVSRNRSPYYGWSDKIYKGEVVRFLRVVVRGKEEATRNSYLGEKPRFEESNDDMET